jgi:hypothetical protein
VSDVEGNIEELEDQMGLDDVARHTRVYLRPDADWVDIDHDLPRIIERLPPDFQLICRRVLERVPISKIAAELNVPRTSVIDMLDQIHPFLAEQGISELF